jgi:hypothetical protein
MQKLYADTTLGFVDNTHFDIPEEYKEKFKCSEVPAASDTSSDDIFGF